jgi:hypothetical protein
MRQILFSLALALAPAAALAASMGVPLDQSALVTLSAPARDVIVGNPAIADVSVSDQRHLIVTGKGPGVTNLLVTDAAGRTIFNRQIVVSGASADRIALINGSTITRYACAPVCEPVGAAQGAPAGGGEGPRSPGLSAPAPAPAAVPAPAPAQP